MPKLTPKDYPDSWPSVRKQILLRAGGHAHDPRVGARCEWCGVENYTVGIRVDDGQLAILRRAQPSYKAAATARDWINANSSSAARAIVIVLTIAHVEDRNPQNIDLDNLAALCQQCHSRHDAGTRGISRPLPDADGKMIPRSA